MIVAMNKTITNNPTDKKQQRTFAACAGEPTKVCSLHPRSADLSESINRINDRLGKALFFCLPQKVTEDIKLRPISVTPVSDTPQCQPTPTKHNKKRGIANSKNTWLTEEMRLYVLYAISRTREIRCALCGAWEGLEMHHKKYYGATIHDIEILCQACHRNVDPNLSFNSDLKTVFVNGVRWCEMAKFKFSY